jgi:hypothetical protein
MVLPQIWHIQVVIVPIYKTDEQLDEIASKRINSSIEKEVKRFC